MSTSIRIRGVPEDVHRTLRARAADAGLSLSDYLLAEVKRVAERPAIADVLVRASRRSGGAPPAAIVEAVRSGRDPGERANAAIVALADREHDLSLESGPVPADVQARVDRMERPG